MLGDVPMLFFLVLVAMIDTGWSSCRWLLIPLTVARVAADPAPADPSARQQHAGIDPAHGPCFEVMNGVDTHQTLGAEAWARRQWEMLTVKISETPV